MSSEQMWVKTELHCHTVYSHDSSNRLSRLIQFAHEIGIQRLAITDHNTISGALKAKEMDPDLIIIGEEIRTTKGELIAYFVDDQIPSGLSPMDAIERLKKQNALISVPHPFDRLRSGWMRTDLLEILPFVDAIEIFNSRCYTPSVNAAAQVFASEKNLSVTVGSDAHSLLEMGSATLLLPEFNSADELRRVLRQGIPSTRSLTTAEHFFSSASIFFSKIFSWNF